MVSSLFSTTKPKQFAGRTRNNAGSLAHEFDSEHKLAQMAVTGTFNSTFYVTAETQLDQVMDLAFKVTPQFLAQVAIYARKLGFMKDMPAFCMAVLANRDSDLFERVFPIVIDNGRMIRNIVQIFRSGKINGRKSIPKAARRQVSKWLIERNYNRLLDESVGETPSIADLIKMVHPKAKNATQEAFFGYLIGNDKLDWSKLPQFVQDFELFKAVKLDGKVEFKLNGIPPVEFRLLTALNLSEQDWKEIAVNGGHHMVRMNLNTFARHGVYNDSSVTKQIAAKLSDRDTILRSKVMPYQLLTTYLNIEDNIPMVVRNALQDAADIALENVPVIDGKIKVFPDVSGSMTSNTVGKGKTRSIDVAALFAAALMKKNSDTEVLPFENRIVSLKLNPRDSIMTNAEKLSKIGGGGTNISLPLKLLNERKETDIKACFFVSDNESWLDGGYYGSGKTAAENEWNSLKQRNIKAKLVCIDVTPNTTTQLKDRKDVMNVGGFSDTVFAVAENFIQNQESWVDVIKRVQLP